MNDRRPHTNRIWAAAAPRGHLTQPRATADPSGTLAMGDWARARLPAARASHAAAGAGRNTLPVDDIGAATTPVRS